MITSIGYPPDIDDINEMMMFLQNFSDHLLRNYGYADTDYISNYNFLRYCQKRKTNRYVDSLILHDVEFETYNFLRRMYNRV